MSGIDQIITRTWQPKKILPPVEWVKENCRLRENISEMPGALHVAPYSVEQLESFADPEIQKVTLCQASQSFKTTTIYAGCAYLLVEFPKDMLYIMPSAENARNFSKGRWMPFIEDCKPLRDLCPISSASGRIDSDRITNMRQEFATCVLTFTGAGSENNVKSAPVAYLILDEIDEIDIDIRLAALERIKGRREYKIIQTSTPQEEEDGIWSEYLMGDQRLYFMPCPHCGEEIDFQWRQIEKKRYSIAFDEQAKLDDGSYDFEMVANTAHYQCQCCDGKIYDADKVDMVKRGKWIPQNQYAPKGHRSYHLNSLYSPMLTFGGIMCQWLQASKSISGLKKFIQGYLAEPWREEATNHEEQEANQLEQDYERGELKGEYRIIGADTQTDSFWFVVRGFSKSSQESWLIDFGQVASFAELDAKYEQYSCSKGIIDCAGDRTQEIYEEVYKRRTKWIGSRGWDKMAEPYRLQKKDPFTGDHKGRAGTGKILYLHIDKGVWEPEIAKLRTGQMSGFFTYTDTDPNYYKQLFATYWTKETDKRGRMKVVKKIRKHRGDHVFDCECMIRALSKFIGIARVDRERPIDEKKPRPPMNRATRNRQATGFW